MPWRRITGHAVGLLALLVIMAPVGGLGARPGSAAPVPSTRGSEPTVRVAVRELEPFVVRRAARLTGFSIELWRDIAERIDVETEFVVVDDVQAQLEAVREGRADLAITAISVTSEREQELDFSEPYLTGGLRILAPNSSGTSFTDTLGGLTDSSVLRLLMLLVVLVVAMGVVVWLVERRRNPEFGGRHGGVWEGIWWAMVTLATVGYGDRVARTGRGRILAVIWMLVALVFVAQFTATVTANLTVRELSTGIESVSDLRSERVLTIRGTTAAEYLDDEGIAAVELSDPAEMVERVAEGDADAAVYDGPVLRYLASRSDDVSLVGEALTDEYYGVAFPTASTWREPVDVALLELAEEGAIRRLRAVWFSGDGAP